MTERKMRLIRPKTRLRVASVGLGAGGSIAMDSLLQVDEVLDLKKIRICGGEGRGGK
jgi:hypothetical protein